jgi:hypothetical protein
VTTPILLGALLPVEYNPRRMSAEAAEHLAGTIRDFGFLQPLVVNTYPGRELRIVGGEQRWRQLLDQLGPDAQVPPIQQPGFDDGTSSAPTPGVVFVHLPLERERELNVRLNRGGAWDWSKLEAEFSRVELMAWGFEHHEFKMSKPANPLALEGGIQPPAAPVAGEGAGSAPPPAVRMQSLYCTPDQWAQLQADVELLQGVYGSDNLTDTVCQAVRETAANRL